MALPSPERRVCDVPTTQEGGTPLSRLVDCYKAVSEGAVVKVLISNGDKNTDERQIVSEVVKAASPMLTSEALLRLSVFRICQ